jgi:uncharacterized damage-inducible protein DinB
VTDPRYPIGEFVFSGSLDAAERAKAIDLISRVPDELRHAVADLSPEQLNTPYREGGWTVRQVVHHLPDSHLNGYMRWKLALTEDRPTIRTYEEARWAELSDSAGPIEYSLDLLEALHARWVRLLRQLPDEAWSRRLRHPEIGEVGLDHMLALYAWHGRHHVAHITTLREQRGW